MYYLVMVCLAFGRVRVGWGAVLADVLWSPPVLPGVLRPADRATIPHPDEAGVPQGHCVLPLLLRLAGKLRTHAHAERERNGKGS